MIYIILYKSVNGHNVSENVMALAIYLLEMAVMSAQVPDKAVSFSLNIFLLIYLEI